MSLKGRWHLAKSVRYLVTTYLFASVSLGRGLWEALGVECMIEGGWLLSSKNGMKIMRGFQFISKASCNLSEYQQNQGKVDSKKHPKIYQCERKERVE